MTNKVKSLSTTKRQYLCNWKRNKQRGGDLFNQLRSNVTTLNWLDTDSNQTTPNICTDISFKLITSKLIKTLWMASPGINGGAAQQIVITQSGSSVAFTLPLLQYRDMMAAAFEYTL